MLKKILVGIMSSAIIMSGYPVAYAAPLGSKSTSTSSSSSGKTGSSFNRSSSSQSNKSNASTGNNRGVLGSNSMGRQSSVLQDRLRSGDRSSPANNTTVAGNNRNNSNNSYAGNNTPNNNNYNNGSYGSGNNNNNYNSGYNQPRQGYSTGALVGAAAAGAIGGYMLNGILHNRDGSVHNGPGYVNGVAQSNGVTAPTNYNNSPAYANNTNSSGGSFWWSLLGFLLVLAFIYAAYKYFTRNNTNKGTDLFNNFGNSSPVVPPIKSFNEASPEDKIRDNKEKIFTELQTNFKPSGIEIYRKYSTTEFFENNLKEAVLNTNDNRTIKVRSLNASLVNLTQEGSNYLADVVYDYVIVEQEIGKEPEEYSGSQGWTFVHPVNSNGDWKLDGITVNS